MKKRPVKGRRPGRRPQGAFTGAKSIEHKYPFTIHLADQYVRNLALGSLQVTGTGGAPLTLGKFSTPGLSSSNLLSYYDFGMATAFSLADLQNSTKFTGLFDHYKIDWVDLEVEFLSNSASVGSTNVMPTCYAYVDRDDANVPTTAGAVQGKQGSKEMAFGNRSRQVFTMRIKPAVSVQVEQSLGSGTGYMIGNGFQDCAYPNNKFYGVKMWFNNVYLPSAATAATVFRFTWKYGLIFKGALNEY